MRLLYVGASALLTDHRPFGEGLIAHRFASALAAQGLAVTVLAPKVDLRDHPPYRAVEVATSARPGSTFALRYAWNVRRWLARHEAPSFDVALWSYPMEPGSLVYLPVQRTPLVIGPVDGTWPSDDEPKVGHRSPHHLLLRSATSWAARSTHRSISGYLEAVPGSLDQYGFRPAAGTVVHVTPGIDPPADWTPPPDAPVIGFLGSLEERKGVIDLVEAMTRVVTSAPSAHLVLAGGGTLENRLRRLVTALQLEEAVSFRGPIAPEEAVPFFRQCTVACLPSHAEPFGMTILEAMAAGRFVVSTNRGGPAAILDKVGARLVPTQRPDELGAALIDVLSDPERVNAGGLHNHRRATEEFSWDSIARRAAAALRQFAGS